MKVAVISDTHDQIWNLRKALAGLADADELIHCGDLCSPFMIKHLAEGFPEKPIHLVWGNNEGDPRMISQVAAGFPDIRLHGQLAQLELGGLRIAVNHYPEIARPLAASGSFDVVCYGHDHTAFEGWVADCLLLNPGEILGMNGPATFAWLETHSRLVQFERLGQ